MMRLNIQGWLKNYKLNTNADNFTSAGARMIGYLNNPKYDIKIILPTDGTLTTFDKCGILFASAEAYNLDQGTIEFNGEQIRIAQSNNAQYSTIGAVYIRINEGNTTKFISGGNRIFWFYPLSAYY